jgi:RimJ/RimL family protein N-acetyltransferase
MLEQADAYRLRRLARAGQAVRPPSPSVASRWLTGFTRAVGVQIRPIRPADDVLVEDVFGHLGPESRRQRFLGVKTVLTPAEMRYLTDVDHHDHEALVAVNRSDGRGVGVARFIRDVEDGRSAELAVTVVDDWQFQGIGTRLVTRLTDRAWTEGVTQFTALVLDENIAAKRLLGHLPGKPVVVDRYEDRVEYVVELVGSRRG